MSFTHQKKLKQKLKRGFFVFLGIYIMISASLYFLQEKLLFLPTTLEQDYTYKFSHDFDELFLKANDGASINAIHFKVNDPKGAIFYLHGNAGDLQRWGEIAEYLVDKNYDVLVMDYRTYGKSQGKLSEVALYADAQMYYDYLKQHYSENDITIYGRSLGSGIATYIGSKNKPRQLVLETPYYSILDVAEYRFSFIPVNRFLKYKILSHKFLKDVSCNVTMIHGTDDSVVPLTSAKRLFESSDKNKTKLHIIEGGSHNDLINFKNYHKLINKLF